MAHVYKLGFGAGKITDNGDGTATYKNLDQEFQVRIADVTGFSLDREQTTLVWTFRILGHGTQLASIHMAAPVTQKIEAWFRGHPDFGRNAPPASVAQGLPPLDGRLIADELIKLAGLRDAGILSEEEFAAQKARLLG
ncbi:SHOCT domain-containing protein [Paenarthrobacter sp. UW852]|uniref:SHOCT domain-containing protein n=1 Tax=Paenarthrobacter sp. UW852 TaxID=2951989 RepID=UPI0021490BAC|nr:SHOCT domain-containing protein [Paenarthrobacter sp. UW852]MCR1160321.1 SHOCT domain-containing protein [Paenarthrobacter sp. UW852]